MGRRTRKLGEILSRWGLVNEKQLQEALKMSTSTGRRLGEVLRELGYVSESDIAKALASQFDMEYIDMDQPDSINADNLGLIPVDVVKKYLVLPLGEENGRLKILIHDPIDLETLDNLKFRLNKHIDTALGAKGKMKEYIERMYSDTKATLDKTVADLSIDSSIDAKVKSVDVSMDSSVDSSMDAEAKELQASAPVVRLVNQVIAEGVMGRASDIHIEPMADRVRLRYRIDGVCVEQDPIPKRTQGAIIARLKIMGGMKVEEKRIPQDGRIKLRVGNDVIDFRVSCCPAYHGESVVMRILRPDSVRIGLNNLGMLDDTRERFDNIIKRPTGIFLVTGPTGSGKTTTLYTALDVMNRSDVKIITAEDPVEYNFKGINQCQVRHDIGLNFSIILRAMLRQAPNIVLVGEIRDKEVADVAIQAALTGHLVFSTLHTNDAPSAITRLTDMGIKPFLVASSVQAVLAQRLIRVLCPTCKEIDPNPDPKIMRIIDMSPEEIEKGTIYRAVGCNECSGTGFRGRRGIYELMMMNQELRELSFKRAPLSKLRKAAMATGMRSLLGDAKLKCLAGLTTPEEVSRLAQADGVIEEDEDEMN